MSTAAEREHVKAIPLALIDPPGLDARIDRDEKELEALGRDIKMNGLIEPLKLLRNGDRFELVDGYCRFLGMRMVGVNEAEAFVYPTRELALEGVKYRANAFHLAMSVGDEAVYFNQLFEHECEHDITRVAALVNKSVNYVSDRINLLTGDEKVFDALREKKIGIGVAQVLNKVEHEQYRRHYLYLAIRDGWTRSSAEYAYNDYKRAFSGVEQLPAVDVEPAPAVPAGVVDVHRCYICGRNDPARIPLQIPVHAECKYATLDPLLAHARGEG